MVIFQSRGTVVSVSGKGAASSAHRQGGAVTTQSFLARHQVQFWQHLSMEYS
jgi:hypothetical protein